VYVCGARHLLSYRCSSSEAKIEKSPYGVRREDKEKKRSKRETKKELMMIICVHVKTRCCTRQSVIHLTRSSSLLVLSNSETMKRKTKGQETEIAHLISPVHRHCAS
jgi:hypothetical protein